MFNDITKPPPPLPTSKMTPLADGLTFLEPLSRRGCGPGIIIITPDSNQQCSIIDGVPSQLQKWAEEGYAVVEIQHRALVSDAVSMFRKAVNAFRASSSCFPKDKTGLVVYDPEAWPYALPALSEVPILVGVVIYGCIPEISRSESVSMPVLNHMPSKRVTPVEKDCCVTKFYYANVNSHLFAIPFQESFDYWAESVSHTRNLTFLKPLMDGPYFDLETIWEEHTYYEFNDRSVEHTMSTMVDQPYVNHVPTLTGGTGRKLLTRFYRDSFIFSNSADTETELISRTLGIDRIVDEFIFKFTHDSQLDWLLPGLPPTHKYVQVPFTAVVNIRGDRLYHEHISWDQGTVLRQLGLMPQYLPFPYSLPGGVKPAAGKRFEYRVPVTGIDATRKMIDRNAVASNQMFDFQVREISK